jgi:hypothetical protein
MIKRAVGLLLVTVAFAACQTEPVTGDFKPALARFYLESGETQVARIVLPQSGVAVAIGPKPVLTEGDIVNVEVVQVDLGKCLLFQFAPAAARDLYRLSASHQGRRLVLMLDGAPVGARRIDGPLSGGEVLVFVEMPDEALPELVVRLKRSADKIQRDLAKK